MMCPNLKQIIKLDTVNFKIQIEKIKLIHKLINHQDWRPKDVLPSGNGNIYDANNIYFYDTSDRIDIIYDFYKGLQEIQKREQDEKQAEIERQNGNKNECIICLDTIIKYRRRFKCLTCKKLAHKACMDKWMIINNTCPHCREIYKIIII